MLLETNLIHKASFFAKVRVHDVLKEISKLDNKKTIHSIDIPVKTLKNVDIFRNYDYHFFNLCVDKSTLPSD